MVLQKSWPSSRPLHGLLGGDERTNPAFHNWNVIDIMYGMRSDYFSSIVSNALTIPRTGTVTAARSQAIEGKQWL